MTQTRLLMLSLFLKKTLVTYYDQNISMLFLYFADHKNPFCSDFCLLYEPCYFINAAFTFIKALWFCNFHLTLYKGPCCLLVLCWNQISSRHFIAVLSRSVFYIYSTRRIFILKSTLLAVRLFIVWLETYSYIDGRLVL